MSGWFDLTLNQRVYNQDGKTANATWMTTAIVRQNLPRDAFNEFTLQVAKLLCQQLCQLLRSQQLDGSRALLLWRPF